MPLSLHYSQTLTKVKNMPATPSKFITEGYSAVTRYAINISDIRKLYGLSQKRFAALLGYSRPWVAKAEKDKALSRSAYLAVLGLMQDIEAHNRRAPNGRVQNPTTGNWE